MKYYHEENIVKKLISEFEDMSHKGMVCFFEKAALTDIMFYYEYDEKLDMAIKVCDYGWEQYPFAWEFLFHKSRYLVEMKNLSAALFSVEEALICAPEHFELNILKIEILIELGEFEDAYFILKELYRSSEDLQQAEVLFLLARIHEINGAFKKMFFALKKALQKDPTHPYLLNKIWLAAEMSGMYEESALFHLDLIDETPYSFLAWYNLGQAYFCLERYDMAAEAFEYAFIINDQFDIAYKDAAESLIMAEEYERALEIYDEFLQVLEADSDVYAKIGLCYEHLNDTKLAKQFYRKSLKQNAFNGMALFRMGECFMAEEKWDKAIKFYNRAIEADCDREEYLIAIAEAYFKNKNLKQAEIFFRKATEMAPELSKYWTQYAAFLIKKGESEAAFIILDEAEAYTVDTEVLYCKAACLFAMKKRKEALHTLSLALQENAALLESLYDLTPELKQDLEVRALVRLFE